jgi:hypothetical protein
MAAELWSAPIPRLLHEGGLVGRNVGIDIRRRHEQVALAEPGPELLSGMLRFLRIAHRFQPRYQPGRRRVIELQRKLSQQISGLRGRADNLLATANVHRGCEGEDWHLTKVIAEGRQSSSASGETTPCPVRGSRTADCGERGHDIHWSHRPGMWRQRPLTPVDPAAGHSIVARQMVNALKGGCNK